MTLNQPSQRNAVAAEADEVLRPLMDLLDGQLQCYFSYIIVAQLPILVLVFHYFGEIQFNKILGRKLVL